MQLAYDYTAKTSRGLVVSGMVFCTCYDDAVYQVRAALRLDPLAIRVNALETGISWVLEREPTRDRIRLYCTIAERKRIGRSIPQGLHEALDYVEDKRFVSALTVMRQSMLDGVKFADAMEKAGFPETDVQAVRAVQSAGKEGEVLASLAERMEAIEAMKQRIAGILWYPVMVLAAMWIVAWAMTLFIAPKIGAFFMKLGSLQLALPAYAEAYYSFAAFFQQHALIGSLVWFAIPVGFVTLLRSRFTAHLVDRIPALYALAMKSDLVSIFSALALLLNAGVKPVEAFASVARSARRADNRERLEEMASIYRAGNYSIAKAVAQCRFPKVVRAEISAGESANSTTEGMRKLVDILRQDLQTHMDQAQRLAVIGSNLIVGLFLLGFVFITVYPQVSATMSRM